MGEKGARTIRDRASHPRAVTAVTPFRWPGWPRWLRGLFWVSPRFLPFLAAPLVKLGFIHVGRWAIVTKLPSRDRPGQWDRVEPKGFLVFETNFDGAWRPYIEAFARVMPTQWLGIWMGTSNFPGPIPASGLLAYIDDHDVAPAYYYTAHGDTSLKSIRAALDVDAALDAFIAADHGPDGFHQAFQKLLAEVQWRL
jgi:hypothetical protein